MAFVQKVNRTYTPSHCTCVFRYKLSKNCPKEGFVKKNNCLFPKKVICVITTKTSFTHWNVYVIVFQRLFWLLLDLILKRHNKQTLLLRKGTFVSISFFGLILSFCHFFFKKLHPKGSPSYKTNTNRCLSDTLNWCLTDI